MIQAMIQRADEFCADTKLREPSTEFFLPLPTL